MTPPRAVLEAPSHAEATQLAMALTGKGVSQQSYALRSKIFEVEEWIAHQRIPIWEVHPEVSFTVLCGRPPVASKKSWTGVMERQEALASAGIAWTTSRPRQEATAQSTMFSMRPSRHGALDASSPKRGTRFPSEPKSTTTASRWRSGSDPRRLGQRSRTKVPMRSALRLPPSSLDQAQRSCLRSPAAAVGAMAAGTKMRIARGRAQRSDGSGPREVVRASRAPGSLRCMSPMSDSSGWNGGASGIETVGTVSAGTTGTASCRV